MNKSLSVLFFVTGVYVGLVIAGIAIERCAKKYRHFLQDEAEQWIKHLS